RAEAVHCVAPHTPAITIAATASTCPIRTPPACICCSFPLHQSQQRTCCEGVRFGGRRGNSQRLLSEGAILKTARLPIAPAETKSGHPLAYTSFAQLATPY